MDLLFDFVNTARPRASVIGTMSRPFAFVPVGPVDVLGVRFRPGGLSGFLAMDAAELTDGRADLANFWGPLAQEVWHRLAEETTMARIGILQEALLARAGGRVRIDPFVHHCVARIQAARGGLRMSDLDRTTGLTARQLERKFSRHLGISPKTFARVVRFMEVSTAATGSDSPDWATLAGDFGFADQSHLARDFKALSGLTPADYLEENRGLPQDVGFLQDPSVAFG